MAYSKLTNFNLKPKKKEKKKEQKCTGNTERNLQQAIFLWKWPPILR